MQAASHDSNRTCNNIIWVTQATATATYGSK